MRTALLLLLLLAIAAVPGSLVPQRSSDPNGVRQYFAEHPGRADLFDQLQLFDVYTSAWFSAIYILLLVSLVGCVIPRLRQHLRAIRSRPPRTPARLVRMDAYATIRLDGRSVGTEGAIVEEAQRILQRRRYRVAVFDDRARGLSVSAERGYLREAGNLLFHIALLGLIVSVGLIGGFGWQGQRILVEGQTFVNGLVSYSSFTPGRFFDEAELRPYAITLDGLDVDYAEGTSLTTGYTAHVTLLEPGGEPRPETVRVNAPLRLGAGGALGGFGAGLLGDDVYLLANGYAPTIVVRDAEGREVFRDAVVFIPQDQNLTSIGVVKVPDGLGEGVGMMGFFYPSPSRLESGAFTSVHPGLDGPLLTLNVYTGDLGLDDGVPRSVYELDTATMTQIAGGDSGEGALELGVGETAQLPGGRGSVTLESVPRYVSFDVKHDPARAPMAAFVLLGIAGLVVALIVPRRRIWVKARPDGDGVLVEYAGLARGEDPRLVDAVNAVLDEHREAIVRLRSGSESTGRRAEERTEGDG